MSVKICSIEFFASFGLGGQVVHVGCNNINFSSTSLWTKVDFPDPDGPIITNIFSLIYNTHIPYSKLAKKGTTILSIP